MISQELQRAREYEAANTPLVPEKERPAFHMTPAVGWMNDPNGFSVYRGEYHLFYQYYPYATYWGPMHWGHVKSKDFIRWERLPAALAPDQAYDRDGCFSGSAAELPDGRHLLMYTGVRREKDAGGVERECQTQCLAVGDGREYEKYKGNPVLTAKDIPDGGSLFDFRDPKLWRGADGTYHAVTVNRMEDGGAVLLFASPDGFSWTFEKILERSRNEYGEMWECPDFFPLDGKQVLLVSPMEAQSAEKQTCSVYGVLCFLGRNHPESGEFIRESVQSVDNGFDFYAPQTMETPDGRRIMTAWMRKWSGISCYPENAPYCGEMILPRELSVRDGCLIQNPVRELTCYRTAPVIYRDIPVTGEISPEGIRGRILDMTLTVRPAGENVYDWFRVCVAKGGQYMTEIQYQPERGMIRIDRSRCGAPCEIVRVREFPVRRQGGNIRLRFLMDRHSLELFVNDGEQAASMRFYTPESADGISFESGGGTALLDIEKYDISV